MKLFNVRKKEVESSDIDELAKSVDLAALGIDPDDPSTVDAFVEKFDEQNKKEESSFKTFANAVFEVLEAGAEMPGIRLCQLMENFMDWYYTTYCGKDPFYLEDKDFVTEFGKFVEESKQTYVKEK
jgi:hypothetical protein